MVSETISIDDERLWDILFEEACVEGQQADRIYKRLKDICGGGWIPVEDRLPEKDGVYDFTVTNGNSEKVVVTWQFLSGKHLSGRQTYIDGIHYIADNYKGDPINKFLSKNVIAWRYRPKPCRKDGGRYGRE